RARARAEEADRKRDILLVAQPVDRGSQTACEEGDVEAMRARRPVDVLLGCGQQIEQQRAESLPVQRLGHQAVARAEPARAAAVGEEDDALRLLREDEIAFEQRAVDGHRAHQAASASSRRTSSSLVCAKFSYQSP